MRVVGSVMGTKVYAWSLTHLYHALHTVSRTSRSHNGEWSEIDAETVFLDLIIKVLLYSISLVCMMQIVCTRGLPSRETLWKTGDNSYPFRVVSEDKTRKTPPIPRPSGRLAALSWDEVSTRRTP